MRRDLGEVARHVVRHRGEDPEAPTSVQMPETTIEQREVAAILGAEAARDDDAARDEGQLEQAGGGERSAERRRSASASEGGWRCVGRCAVPRSYLDRALLASSRGIPFCCFSRPNGIERAQ